MQVEYHAFQYFHFKFVYKRNKVNSVICQLQLKSKYIYLDFKQILNKLYLRDEVNVK